MFDVFSSERAVKEFVAKDRSFAQKVLDHIKGLIAEIKNIYKKLVASGNYDDIAAWQEDLNALEKVNNMMLDALANIEQRKNIGHRAEKNTSDEVKNSMKIYPNMSESERANILKKTNLNVTKFGAKNTKLTSEEVESLKDTYTKNASKVIFELCKRFGVNKSYENANVNLSFNYSKRSVHKSINKASKIKADYLDFAKMLSVFDGVVENAVPIETHYDKYKGTSRENKNLAQDYVLFSAFKDGEYIIPIEFNIKEFKSGNQNQLYVSVNLKKIEAGVLELLSDDNHPGGNSRPTSKYSLAEIIKNVNPTDGDFLKYVPDNLLNAEQKEGKEKALIEEHNKIEKYRAEADETSKSTTKFSTKRNVEEIKQNQLDIINETNPAPNTYSTWIRTVDDIKTFSETLEDDDWEYEEINPDLTRTDIQNAIKSGEITVYSSYPIENGVFVSPSRMEAESYSGNGKVYEKTVDINDVAWIDPTQGQYAKVDDVKFATKRLTGDSPLSYNNRAKPNPRSSINWVYKAELFSVVENKLFHQKISEINQGSRAFKKNADGEYMLPIENKIVFTNGDYGYPEITKIIEFMSESQTSVVNARKVIYSVEKGESSYETSRRALENLYGQGFVYEYHSGDNRSYEWGERYPKGRNRRAIINHYIREQNRARNDSEVEANQSITPSTKSETSVTYDDNGDVIPLSKRFDDSKDDIRFATKRYWTPDMPKADFEHIKRVAQNELYKTDNYLDNITKWLYNIKNGKTYFALYSTEDELEPTILYASINGQATVEYDFVMSYLNELGDESDDGKAKTFNEILEDLKNSDDLRTVYSGMPSNRRNGDGDVPIYSRSPRSGLSRALLNCLQDSYERRRSVENPQKYSTKRETSLPEDASDYILDSKEYQDIIKIVDQRYNLTNKKNLSQKAIDRLAGRLLSKSKSQYSREQLTERLRLI